MVRRGEEERRVMLHEMVHIRVRGERIHGTEFRTELLRFASMGEDWAKDDAFEYEMDERIGDLFIYATMHWGCSSWIVVIEFITPKLGINAATLLRLRPDLPGLWRWGQGL